MKSYLRIVLPIVSFVLILCLVFILKPEPNKQYQFFKENAAEKLASEEQESEGKVREGNPNLRASRDVRMFASPLTGEIPAGIRDAELRYAKTLPVRTGKTEATTWTRRGPYNIGGRTRALGYDIRNSAASTTNDVLLIGGVAGGIWRSTNGGSSWTNTTTTLQLPSVTCLVQDTRIGKQDTWYAGTGERVGNSASKGGAPYRGNGIYKSTNNGLSWSVLASTSGAHQLFDSPYDYTTEMVIDKSNTVQDEVYIAATRGVYRSVDGGTSWSLVLGSSIGTNTAGSITDVAITSTGVVYATIGSLGASETLNIGIYRSVDGLTWTQIDPAGTFSASPARTEITVAPSNENIVYMLSYNRDGTSSFLKYTYVSGDGSSTGGTWVDNSVRLPSATTYSYSGAPYNDLGEYDSQGGYDIVLEVKPDDANYVVFGGTNLYRTTDGLATTLTNNSWIGGYDPYLFYELGTAPQHPDQHNLLFTNNPIVAYSVHDGGISRSSNINTSVTSGYLSSSIWAGLNNGYYTTQFYTIAIDHVTANSNTLIGGKQDNGTNGTDNQTLTSAWFALRGGDGSYCAVSTGTSLVVVSSQTGNVARKAGLFGAAVTITPTTLNAGATLDFINPFVMDDNNRLYYISDTRILRNANAATATTSTGWTAMTGTTLTGGDYINQLAISRTTNRLYYSSASGDIFRITNAQTGVGSPTNITAALMPSANVSCIAINPDNDQEIIVVYSNYQVESVWHTTNAGAATPTWTAISGNLEEGGNPAGNGPACTWAAFLPSLPSGDGLTRVYIGTTTGLYSTETLNGSSTVWSQESPDLIGNAVIDMVVARKSDGKVFIGTHGKGTFQGVVSEATPIDPSQFSNNELQASIGQNPFQTSTTLTYYLPNRTAVQIDVLDGAGRKVHQYEEGVKDKGTHTLTIDGSLWRSGLFYYRVRTTDGKVATGKMVLVR